MMSKIAFFDFRLIAMTPPFLSIWNTKEKNNEPSTHMQLSRTNIEPVQELKYVTFMHRTNNLTGLHVDGDGVTWYGPWWNPVQKL